MSVRNKPRRRRRKVRKGMSKKDDLMDDVEKITAATATITISGHESQGSVEEDIKVLNKAMEKIVQDIRFLQTLTAEVQSLKQENQWLRNRIDELSHAVGADQNLHEWQVDAAEDEDVIETPLSNKELMRKMNEYADRRIQHGMH